MVSTSSYAVELQDESRGIDTSRFVRGTLGSLMLGNGNAETETIIRNDNPIVVEHVHSLNSVTKGRRSNLFLEINREELETNPWLPLSHIVGDLDISDDMKNQRPGLS